MTSDVKCRDTDYIDFLIASPKSFSCTEAAKMQPESPDAPTYDAFTRLLRRLVPDPGTLWAEARPGSIARAASWSWTIRPSTSPLPG
jgi:putative transposase